MSDPTVPPPRLVEVAPGLCLAVEESGDPSGVPVLFFHGWPASRLQGAGFSVEAGEFGARIISPDRPGVGLSSFQKGRALLDWPPLVRELARALGVKRFRILAVSGGGPYALATAFALPDCVEAVSIVSGAPPLDSRESRAAVMAVYRWLLAAHRLQPAAVRWFFTLARPFATARPPLWSWPLLLRCVPVADRAALGSPAVFEGSFGCYREAWRGSARGVISDAEVYGRDWGFALEEILVPVRLWHGKNDGSFPWPLAARMAERLPNCAARFIEDEGHYSLPIRRRREILEDLMTCVPAAGR